MASNIPKELESQYQVCFQAAIELFKYNEITPRLESLIPESIRDLIKIPFLNACFERVMKMGTVLLAEVVDPREKYSIKQYKHAISCMICARRILRQIKFPSLEEFTPLINIYKIFRKKLLTILMQNENPDSFQFIELFIAHCEETIRRSEDPEFFTDESFCPGLHKFVESAFQSLDIEKFSDKGHYSMLYECLLLVKEEIEKLKPAFLPQKQIPKIEAAPTAEELPAALALMPSPASSSSPSAPSSTATASEVRVLPKALQQPIELLYKP